MNGITNINAMVINHINNYHINNILITDHW